MTEHADPISFLFDHSPGKSLLGRIKEGEGELDHQAVLARLTESQIDPIPERPDTGIRADAIIRNGVGCVPLLTVISWGKEDLTLETWINIYDGYPRRKNPLLDLQSQDVLPVLLFADSREPERVFHVPNDVDWGEINRKMPDVIWSGDEYMEARDQIMEEFPELIQLWQVLE